MSRDETHHLLLEVAIATRLKEMGIAQRRSQVGAATSCPIMVQRRQFERGQL